MFRRLTLVLVLAGLGLAMWGAQTSAACSFPSQRPALRERLAAAPGAFVGTVISRRDTPPRPDGTYGSGDPTELRFAVERAYKGDLGSEVDVMTVRGAVTCGLPAQPGDRLALLLGTDEQGRWTAFLGSAVDPAELEDAARALAAPAEPPPAHSPPLSTVQSARVIRVIDGDTLKVRLTGGVAAGLTVNVRLIGIDTPKTRKTGTRVECGGLKATARMKRLAFVNGRGRAVGLTSDPTQGARDRIGRRLSYVSSRAGLDFGRAMISSGWAKTYVFKRDFESLPAYRRAEAAARAARRGVWRRCAGNFHRPA